MDIMKKYIYAHSQLLARHDIDDDASPHKDDLYFYLHDRLGSVRQVINTSGNVENCYTYDPFGELFETETEENINNPFKFAGQYFDSEIVQYYLRARQYDPHTARDPVFGKFKEPLIPIGFNMCACSDAVYQLFTLLGMTKTGFGAFAGMTVGRKN